MPLPERESVEGSIPLQAAFDGAQATLGYVNILFMPDRLIQFFKKNSTIKMPLPEREAVERSIFRQKNPGCPGFLFCFFLIFFP